MLWSLRTSGVGTLSVSQRGLPKGGAATKAEVVCRLVLPRVRTAFRFEKTKLFTMRVPSHWGRSVFNA